MWIFKKNLKITLLIIFDDQPGGAVLDLVMMPTPNKHEKKIAYMLAWKEN